MRIEVLVKVPLTVKFPGIVVFPSLSNNVNSLLTVVHTLFPSYYRATIGMLFHPLEISKGLVAPMGPTVPILEVELLPC